MDGTFFLFRSTGHVEKFKKHLNKQRKNIAFTSEMEQNGSLSFLGIKISGENNKCVTSIYRKPTFIEVFTNFESFISKCYKRSLIDTLLYSGFSLCSNMEKFHQESSSPKSVFKSNGYPKNFIDSCIKQFLDKLFVKNKVSLTVPKLQLVCVLPYTGKSSLDLRAHLRRTIEKNIPFCKLNVVLRSTCRLGNLFRFKDSLVKKIISGIVYRYTCSNCKVTYYGKTFRYFFTRAFEHIGTSNLAGKRIKNAKELAISEHLLQCDSPIISYDFDILASDSNKFKLLIKESLLIKCGKSILNIAAKSFPLDLSD